MKDLKRSHIHIPRCIEQEKPYCIRRFARRTDETENLGRFVLEVDELLSLYMDEVDALILCGPKSYTSAFVNRCSCPQKIISIINGDFRGLASKDIAEMVWAAVKQFSLDKMIDEISRFEDKLREGLAEEGIIEVWRAIEEGRGVILLIEKDLRIHGFSVGQIRRLVLFSST